MNLSEEVERKRSINKAVTAFAQAMVSRMYEKIRYKGWDDPKLLSNDLLKVQMQADLQTDMINQRESKMIDIANRAMMLWYRTYGNQILKYQKHIKQTIERKETDA